MTSTFKTKKSLGQNFLMHSRIAEHIALSAQIENKTVFEIGPGKGMLTEQLLKIAKKVIAIEADEELFNLLQSKFSNEISKDKLELIHGDIRSFDLNKLPKGYSLVANIPYYITGEIFRMFLESDNQPSSMTLLVQKEVAERIARSAKASILSISVKAYGTPKYEFTVPRGAFNPAPNVDSAVISIKDISRNNFKNIEQEDRFFKLVHAGFAHKRKMLKKNLIDAGFSAELLKDDSRAEDLSLKDWLNLSMQ